MAYLLIRKLTSQKMKKSRTVLHEPNLSTIMMIENSILKSKIYPTKMQLWKSLPKQVQYQTLLRVLDYLEASGKIAYNAHTIIYTGINNKKLAQLLKSSVRRTS